MCLEIFSNAIEQIAKQDIVCYKLVEQRPYCRYLKTYYQDTSVELGKTYTSTLKRPSDTRIEKGLHSFSRMGGIYAIYGVTHLGRKGTIVHIVRCVIPKGAKYYVGSFCGEKSYASSMVTYIEIVHTYKPYSF